MAASGRVFLTARWEHVVVLNFTVSPDALHPLVPAGTELELWHGEAIVSLIGFMFRDTRVRGMAIAGHREFEEVNLRFYVRRHGPLGEVRRAVVFIRELVPRLAVALIARYVYNEPYLALPMSHALDCDPARGGTLSYRWRYRGEPFAIDARVEGPAQPAVAGTEAEFIVDHDWGYTRQRDGTTLEYRVEHPPWRVWTPAAASFTGPASRLYGDVFGEALAARPRSALVATGSDVTVYTGVRVA